MAIFGAKLLFQFRIKGSKQKRRLCEERIINLEADSNAAALKAVESYARQGQHHYLNDDQATVYFEFVGVLDLIELGDKATEEKWYDLRYLRLPKENRKKLLPSRKNLISGPQPMKELGRKPKGK